MIASPTTPAGLVRRAIVTPYGPILGAGGNAAAEQGLSAPMLEPVRGAEQGDGLAAVRRAAALGRQNSRVPAPSVLGLTPARLLQVLSAAGRSHPRGCLLAGLWLYAFAPAAISPGEIAADIGFSGVLRISGPPAPIAPAIVASTVLLAARGAKGALAFFSGSRLTGGASGKRHLRTQAQIEKKQVR